MLPEHVVPLRHHGHHTPNGSCLPCFAKMPLLLGISPRQKDEEYFTVFPFVLIVLVSCYGRHLTRQNSITWERESRFNPSFLRIMVEGTDLVKNVRSPIRCTEKDWICWSGMALQGQCRLIRYRALWEKDCPNMGVRVESNSGHFIPRKGHYQSMGHDSAVSRVDGSYHAVNTLTGGWSGEFVESRTVLPH